MAVVATHGQVVQCRPTGTGASGVQRVRSGDSILWSMWPLPIKSVTGERPVPERTQQASHSLAGLDGSGDEDGLTGSFLVGPKLGRVTPLGYTSIGGRRRFRHGCSQKESTSRSRDSRNFRKLTPR
jgi:hypothetical protein